MNIKSNAAPVRFDQVTKAYGDVIAVNEVSFEVAAGELVTLLGPSGCGKTTTLRLIAGLEMATRGRIFIGDDDVTTLPATDRDVSMVFQSYALFPHMTVGENVAYGLSVSGVAKGEARGRARDALDLVGMADLGDRMPSALSGGQQQRVAVARALVLEPQVLLFDEPLSNLDAKLRRRVREEVREIQQNLTLTTVYVTHDQEEALAVSDRVIVMRNSEIAQEGTPRELYESPSDEFVADFIGDSNIVDGEVVSVSEGMARVRIGASEISLPCRFNSAGPVKIAIRPNAVGLTREISQNDFTGVVQKATYLGSHVEYTIDTGLGSLFVVGPVIAAPLQIGSDVAIELRHSGIALIAQPNASKSNV